MKISGFQKLTLLDFPGRTACTVFTHGCNLRCPFCHNAPLVTRKDNSEFTEEEFFNYISKRKGIIDGVAITGGEPLLHKDVFDFIARIHDLGFSVKLDTNGFFPSLLYDIIKSGNVSYIAMDIKNTPEKYGATTGIEGISIDNVYKSIDHIIHSGLEYEFRTTAVAEFHNPEDFTVIAEMIEGADVYYIQKFKDSGDLITEGLHPLGDEDMRKCAENARKVLNNVSLRGV